MLSQQTWSVRADSRHICIIWTSMRLLFPTPNMNIYENIPGFNTQHFNN